MAEPVPTKVMPTVAPLLAALTAVGLPDPVMFPGEEETALVWSTTTGRVSVYTGLGEGYDVECVPDGPLAQFAPNAQEAAALVAQHLMPL
ncbi:hypothetical protein LG293_17225 (plasmid) [Citricoccus nitrophenolicus]